MGLFDIIRTISEKFLEAAEKQVDRREKALDRYIKEHGLSDDE